MLRTLSYAAVCQHKDFVSQSLNRARGKMSCRSKHVHHPVCDLHFEPRGAAIIIRTCHKITIVNGWLICAPVRSLRDFYDVHVHISCPRNRKVVLSTHLASPRTSPYLPLMSCCFNRRGILSALTVSLSKLRLELSCSSNCKSSDFCAHSNCTNQSCKLPRDPLLCELFDR